MNTTLKIVFSITLLILVEVGYAKHTVFAAHNILDAKSRNVGTDSNALIPTNYDETNMVTALVDNEVLDSVNRKKNPILLKVLNKKKDYKTGIKNTLVVSMLNTGEKIKGLKFEVKYPNAWTTISTSSPRAFKLNEKKIGLISFSIPSGYLPGDATIALIIKNSSDEIISQESVVIRVANNFGLEVFKITAPQSIQSGESVEVKYGIKNTGNISQKVELNSRNAIVGNEKITIAPDSTVVVIVKQDSDKKNYNLRTMSVNLQVKSLSIDKVHKVYSSIQVFPNKIKQKDSFLRFPVRSSLFYSSYSDKEEHFSTLSAEITGDGYLDKLKNHYLNFRVRGPKQENIRRFGISDQYSFIYKYKNKTTLYLGDHGYYINRLGFGNRFGMGFMLEHLFKKWRVAAYYSKPRLFAFNSSAVYGALAEYRFNKFTSVGLSLSNSDGVIEGPSFNGTENLDKRAQIATFNFQYKKPQTFIEAESSYSLVDRKIDFANFISVVQKIKNISYSGTFTSAGENYLGFIRNSLRYSNRLNFQLKKWNFALGQSLSKVNETLDPLLYAAQPYFETYYGLVGYRFSQKNYLSLRINKRINEDQSFPVNYYYKEYGVDYRYIYSASKFNFSFTGRIASTKNLISLNNGYRRTYAHNLNVSYRYHNSLSLRATVIHNYSNRYGTSTNLTNNYRYSLGGNYSLNKNIRLSANYNSGFSPEENYLRRDFISANLNVRLSKNHEFECRANYFESPGVNDRKEYLVYGKYTYTMGVPVKRILKQGGLKGRVQSTNTAINLKGIRVVASGKSLRTNAVGQFELNNLQLGKNYVFIDESTLPKGVVALTKAPFEVLVDSDRMQELNISLGLSGAIKGRISHNLSNKKELNLKAYLRLKNKNFTYYVESTKEGAFTFQNIVPGVYDIEIIRFGREKLFEQLKKSQVIVTEGEEVSFSMQLKAKERRIKFKNKNYKVGG